VILCDTGVMICLIDKNQPQHQAYRLKVASIQEAEAMHLSLGRGGWQMQKKLSKFVLNEIIGLYDIQPADHSRLFELMEQYKDRPMDLADATLVLVAEKMSERRILTTDSDFLFYRIAGKESFEIIEA
jgi:uncharacterized protein